MKIEMSARCLTLFTKPARAGRVKTRLIGQLTPEQAAELHGAFRDDLLEQLAGGAFTLRIAWALDPNETLPDGPVEGFRQVGHDLGERLFRALHAVGRVYPLVGAVGSDHPLLSARVAEEAFERVEAGADVVLGPASDGGYYLIVVGASALDRRIFAGVTWSSPHVLDQTVDRCRSLGLELSLLEVASDVDTPEDLERLTHTLAASVEPACRRTRALLAGWGRLNGGGGG